jgi:hypothetical protein
VSGQAFESRSFIMLRAARVRGLVDVDESNMFPGFKLRTPIIRLTLEPPDPPKVSVNVHVGSPTAVFLRGNGTAGRLHFMDWIECFYPGADHLGQSGDFVWRTFSTMVASLGPVGSGESVTPVCFPESVGGREGEVVQWHIIAGWPNHSAVIVNFPRA